MFVHGRKKEAIFLDAKRGIMALTTFSRGRS